MAYNISPHITGDTWEGISSITFLKNSSAINLTDTFVEMNVRLSLDSPVVFSLTTPASSGITILNPLSGSIRVLPTTVNIPVGDYKWNIKMTFPDGTKKTYLMGNWPITSDLP
jgi:hypothetical protein